MSNISMPPRWAPTTLEELLPLTYGKALVESSRNTGGTIAVFGSSGIVGRHDSALVSGPVLIVGRKGNVGSVYLSRDDCWVIDTAYFAVIPPHLDARFFFYLLRFLTLRNLDKSTAVPGLSRDDYNKVLVAIPPPMEQRRIADEIEALFTDLDAAVAALKRVQANLKRYRASVLKAACEGRLVPTEAELARKEGRTYETGEQLLARILKERRAKWEADQLAKMLAAGKPPKDDSWKKKYREPESPGVSSQHKLPEGWVSVSLDALSNRVGDVDHKMPKAVDDGIPYISTKPTFPF